jgi:FKBP-type peptidyl-prolyl cis-trans isomerase
VQCFQQSVHVVRGSKRVQVMKRQLKRGIGEFPLDAPVHDATVRLHYSIYRPGAPDDVLFTTRNAGAAAEEADDAGGAGDPFHFTTGDGAMPTGVEMAVKLMLPHERCSVAVEPDFGFATCVAGAHAGLPRDEALVFELELVSFVKEVHPEAMTADQARSSPCAQRSVQCDLVPSRAYFSVIKSGYLRSLCKLDAKTATCCSATQRSLTDAVCR